mgnify:CR=1 FL=1
MNAEQHVPQFRFKGFSDSWEQHKLSDGTNKIGDGLHGTPKYSEDGDVYFVNGNNLVNGQIVITSETKRVTSNEQSKDDKALNENTILMSINGTIGNLAWYRGENLMLGKSAAYIEVSNFDKKFIYTYLQTRPVKDYYLNSLTGTTIKNLGLKAIRNTNIYTPTIDEQAKIGVLFQNLDMTITLHQRKLAKLKELKKGYLQKLFPQNSEKVPEFRFKGYSDAWEKRKLGSLGKIKSGNGFPPREQGGHEGIPFYKVSDMNTFGNEEKMVTSQNYVTDFQVKRRKWNPISEVPAIIFAKVGAAIFLDRKRLVEQTFLMDNNMMAYILGESWNSKFCQSLFQTITLSKFAQTGALPSYNASDIAGITIFVPTNSEQKEIGLLIFKVTELIAATQCKLDLLKKLKKGYLQKMFC